MEYSASLTAASDVILSITSKFNAIILFRKIDELMPSFNCTLVQSVCSLTALCKNILHDNGNDCLQGIISPEPVIAFPGPQHTRLQHIFHGISAATQ